jgi:hypothetical protein
MTQRTSSPRNNMKFLMLALSGERHEDYIPQGLYTLYGFQQFIANQAQICENEGFEYYIFVMEPDFKVSELPDYDHSIIFDPSFGFCFDDNELSLFEILSLLDKELNN